MDLLDKMATYVRVIEAGSLAGAAKQLRISGAAVSRQLATLESELGAPLVHRTTRRMTITEAGQRYYERCLRVLREVDDAQAIGRTKGLAGPLKINAPVSFGLGWMVPRMEAFLRAHPSIRVELQLEDRRVDLALDDVDVAIRVGTPPPDTTEIVAHALTSYRRVLVAAPSYLARRGTPKTLEALAKHDALTHAFDSDTWTLQQGKREVRAPIRVGFRTNAFHAIRDLAVGGTGIAFLPEWFVAPELERGALRMILRAWSSAPVSANAIHRRERRGEARVRALVEHLRS